MSDEQQPQEPYQPGDIEIVRNPDGTHSTRIYLDGKALARFVVEHLDAIQRMQQRREQQDDEQKG